MEVKDYKSNSNKSKGNASPENLTQKKVEKVTTRPVKTRKKSELSKFAQSFISEDIGDVRNYIIEDVIIPAIKNIIVEAIESLLGVNGTSNIYSSRHSTPASRISYSRYYNDRSDDDRRDHRIDRRPGYDFQDVICESRGDAQEVINRMFEMADMYGIVRVADLYDIAGVTGKWTDNDYGWTASEVRKATIVRTRRGGEYLIKMPRAFPLD